MERVQEKGFSLIESLIVVSIIAIMSALSLQALPVARSHQQLVADTEQIRALLLDAKERALNQVRPADCLKNPSDPSDVGRAPCSDVGIAFVGNQVTEFADTVSNNQYDVTDYKIATFDLVSAPGTGSVASLVFKSVPPSTTLYANGSVLDPSATAMIVLNGYGSLSRTLLVHSYGTIDVQ